MVWQIDRHPDLPVLIRKMLRRIQTFRDPAAGMGFQSVEYEHITCQIEQVNGEQGYGKQFFQLDGL